MITDAPYFSDDLHPFLLPLLFYVYSFLLPLRFLCSLSPLFFSDAPMTLTNGCSPLFDESIRSVAKRTLLL